MCVCKHGNAILMLRHKFAMLVYQKNLRNISSRKLLLMLAFLKIAVACLLRVQIQWPMQPPHKVLYLRIDLLDEYCRRLKWAVITDENRFFKIPIARTFTSRTRRCWITESSLLWLRFSVALRSTRGRCRRPRL